MFTILVHTVVNRVDFSGGLMTAFTKKWSLSLQQTGLGSGVTKPMSAQGDPDTFLVLRATYSVAEVCALGPPTREQTYETDNLNNRSQTHANQH